MNELPKKISVKIWLPALKKLDEKLENACIRRDAYLNKILETELTKLDEEVALPNSQKSADFIRERLNQLDRKLVSLALREDLVNRLDEICARKRIDRDSFFNRLFLFLASDKILKRCFPTMTTKWVKEYSTHPDDAEVILNGLYPLPSIHDPFWAIRCSLEQSDFRPELIPYVDPESGGEVLMEEHWSGDLKLPDNIYTKVIEDTFFKETDLRGINCYLPDWLVPGTNESLQHRKSLDDII